ncbi:MAG: glycoside hydrolase family 3 C-terminal domain-containing protein [Clostridiaceae bacterium]
MENMGIADKLRLLNGKDFWTTYGNAASGIREIVFSDGPAGLRFQPGENDHLGLNESSKATCFPSPAALSCSWDPALVQEVSACISKEAAEKGVDIVLAPGVNIKRSPLCGRNFEYYSEDPYLTKELGAAFVKGLQENGIGSSLKHFAANNQEAYRMSIDTQIDERALHEIYLKAFKEIIEEAGPWTVMSAYNKLSGEYCSENKWLLTGLLREKWGYEGMVISDWYAVNDIIKSINNGLDLEMPSVDELSFNLLMEGYKNGELDENAVNRAVKNITGLMKKCDNSIKKYGKADYNKHHEIARKSAAESFVLLKNSGYSLPLKPEDKILCAGELMNSPIIQGNGSSRVNAMEVDSIPEELVKAGFQYTFEPGYRQDDEQIDEELAGRAVKAAENADKIIFFAGLFNCTEAESYDRENLRLPRCQDDLIDRLSKLEKELIIVLQTGSAVEMPWINGADSILQMHLSGQGAGKALADVLSGKINPCGKLTETYPEKLSHIPSYLFRGNSAQVEYRESIFTGYRYYDKKDLNVLFPFGHGLSYTEFAYEALNVERTGENFLVSLKVTNTGAYKGKEIIQVYTSLNENAAIQPVRRLAAFSKVSLKPGGNAVVSFTLTDRDFMYYDAGQKEFVLATGLNTIEVGKSSRSIELKATVEITKSNKKYARITGNTTFGEIQSIPALREIADNWLNTLMQKLGLQEDEVINAKELERSMFYMPLRNAVQVSNGEFSFAELNSFIDLLNKKIQDIGRLA